MASFQVFRDDFQRTNASAWGQSPAPILRTWAATTGESVNGEFGIISASSSAPTSETSIDLTGLHLATSGEVIITASVSATTGALATLIDDFNNRNVSASAGTASGGLVWDATFADFGTIGMQSVTTGKWRVACVQGDGGVLVGNTIQLPVDIQGGTIALDVSISDASAVGTDVELWVRVRRTASGSPSFQEAFQASFYNGEGFSGASLSTPDGSDSFDLGVRSVVVDAPATITFSEPNMTVVFLGQTATAPWSALDGTGATMSAEIDLVGRIFNSGASAGTPFSVAADNLDVSGVSGGSSGGYAYLQAHDEDSTHNIALIVGWDSTAYPYSLRIYNYGISANYVSNSGSGLSTGVLYNVKWDISRSRGDMRARIWQASASEPGTWNVTTDLENDFSFTTLAAGIAGAGLTTGFDYIEIADQEPSEDDNESIVDLTNTVCYNGYCFGFTYPAGGGPGSGSYIKRIFLSEVETVGYNDKRALQDGKDAADVFLGQRNIQIEAAVYGSSRGAAFDELALVAKAFHPVDAFEEDTTNLGFLPLDFYRPTADIVTWPLSAYPNGIPLRVYCRPAAPVRYNFVREKTGGIDEKGLALEPTPILWARDPRFYLQTDQSVSISTSTTTLTYRGDYESWPIVSFTMTAAGNSACQIVIAGGSVKINLSATTTGSYEIDYMARTLKRTSDGTIFTSLFDSSFTQDFRVVRNASTARVSSTTGMSSIAVGYREAFV